MENEACSPYAISEKWLKETARQVLLHGEGTGSDIFIMMTHTAIIEREKACRMAHKMRLFHKWLKTTENGKNPWEELAKELKKYPALAEKLLQHIKNYPER